ncbi:MAG: UDP-N-acetylmuramate--L-alanine ligase [Paludibacteraceae bacterium]|nr:UDP-N-acetylmuramate--L-alanine ligase [Paludibacteraceae bacterium]
MYDGRTYFFLGIGGIGMSALARFFKAQGCTVNGYDRTRSELTKELEEEGIGIIYDETKVEKCTKDKCTMYDGLEIDKWVDEDTIVVRTPAVPEDLPLCQYIHGKSTRWYKRAEILGQISGVKKKSLCVAGTHGKTTTSTMLTHLIRCTKDTCTKYEGDGVNAFLGGISRNYGTNVLIDKESEFVVVEADEYDRSFLHLRPYMSVITAIDPDHLDIYGDAQGYQEGFNEYAALVERTIVLKAGYKVERPLRSKTKDKRPAKIIRYCGERGKENGEADCYAQNVRVIDGQIIYDVHLNDLEGHETDIRDLRLGVPAYVNIENSVAAITMAWLNGVDEDAIRRGIETFQGVQRRFNVHVQTHDLLVVDDYAHHPTELQACLDSVRFLYPERPIIAVFQPHLYTRTRDFMDDFARVLSQADELILLPIYPAREEPIEGVTSEMLKTKVERCLRAHRYKTKDRCAQRQKTKDLLVEVVEKADLVEAITVSVERLAVSGKGVTVLMLGAGDIDRLVQPVVEELKSEK